jgi:hypothetical protein
MNKPSLSFFKFDNYFRLLLVGCFTIACHFVAELSLGSILGCSHVCLALGWQYPNTEKVTASLWSNAASFNLMKIGMLYRLARIGFIIL